MCSIEMSGETYGVQEMGSNKTETRGAPRVKVKSGPTMTAVLQE